MAQPKYEGGESKSDEGVVNISGNTSPLIAKLPFLMMLHGESTVSFCGSSEANKQNFIFPN